MSGINGQAGRLDRIELKEKFDFVQLKPHLACKEVARAVLSAYVSRHQSRPRIQNG
jgi:hypothetical protein